MKVRAFTVYVKSGTGGTVWLFGTFSEVAQAKQACARINKRIENEVGCYAEVKPIWAETSGVRVLEHIREWFANLRRIEQAAANRRAAARIVGQIGGQPREPREEVIRYGHGPA
jgi:hypothetical protein